MPPTAHKFREYLQSPRISRASSSQPEQSEVEGSAVLHGATKPVPIPIHVILSEAKDLQFGQTTIADVSDQRKRTPQHAPKAHLPG
jgi:hypothetical protein